MSPLTFLSGLALRRPASIRRPVSGAVLPSLRTSVFALLSLRTMSRKNQETPSNIPGGKRTGHHAPRNGSMSGALAQVRSVYPRQPPLSTTMTAMRLSPIWSCFSRSHGVTFYHPRQIWRRSCSSRGQSPLFHRHPWCRSFSNHGQSMRPLGSLFFSNHGRTLSHRHPLWSRSCWSRGPAEFH